MQKAYLIVFLFDYVSPISRKCPNFSLQKSASIQPRMTLLKFLNLVVVRQHTEGLARPIHATTRNANIPGLKRGNRERSCSPCRFLRNRPSTSSISLAAHPISKSPVVESRQEKKTFSMCLYLIREDFSTNKTCVNRHVEYCECKSYT